MKKSMTVFFLTTLIMAVNLHAIYAQEGITISIGAAKKIFSRILNEERQINIGLPAGYETSKRKYPLFIFSDGEEDYFKRTAGMVRHYNFFSIPEMILVGLPNTNRGRDLSPYVSEQNPQSGGGGNFLRFITEELIPFIDKNYRTTDFRIISGESAGGQFALYAFFARPEYFSACIGSGPAIGIGYDKFSVMVETLLSKEKSFNKALFIPYYEKDFTIATDYVPQLLSILKKYSPEGFRVETKIYPGRNHVPRDGVKDGLLWIFSGWSEVEPPEIYPTNGTFKQGKSITVTIRSEEEVRYTMDGQEPTKESPLYKEPLVISKSTVIKAKAFRKNLAESRIATAGYDEAKNHILEKKISSLKQGLTYKYLERNWYTLPDTINIQPTKEGIAEKITTRLTEKFNGFLFQFDGYIKITQNGDYTFYLYNDAQCKLFINNMMIFHTRNINAPKEISFRMPMEKGFYRIKALYTNFWLQGNELKLSYEGPGIKKQEIPKDVLFYKPNK